MSGHQSFGSYVLVRALNIIGRVTNLLDARSTGLENV